MDERRACLLKWIVTDADVSEMDKVNELIEQVAEEKPVPPKPLMQIMLAVEELFVNVAHYAYDGKPGKVKIGAGIELAPAAMKIIIEDMGKPFDPLAKEEADVTLSADERPIGGLGIFLVRKTMDDVSYERDGDTNRLTIRKLI